MKKLVKVLPVVLVICLMLVNVFAVDVPTVNPTGTASTEVTNAAGKIWATIASVVQVLAIAAVVFAGLRYMFAGADQKADIKKGLGILALGAVLVFAATTVLKIFSDIL